MFESLFLWQHVFLLNHKPELMVSDRQIPARPSDSSSPAVFSPNFESDTAKAEAALNDYSWFRNQSWISAQCVFRLGALLVYCPASAAK